MHSTNELLDAAKAAQGLPSDYALSKALKVPTGGMSNYRNGRSVPDASIGLRLCDLLKLEKQEDRAYVMACLEHERAQRAGREDMAAMWEIVAGKFKAAAQKLARYAKAAALFLSVALLSMFIGGGPDGTARAAAPFPGGDQPAPQFVTNCVGSVCALCKIRHAPTASHAVRPPSPSNSAGGAIELPSLSR